MTDEELAQGYVVGTLDAPARERVRIRAIEDRGFSALVNDWEMKLAPLALNGEAALPSGLFDKIDARITSSGVELPGTFTKRANTGEWVDAAPGLKIKMMHEIPELRRQTFMAWLRPGAEYVDHDHDQDEEIYMIEGDLIIGNLVLRAGDFHVAKAGKHHPAHRSKTGCICLITQATGPV
jgi:quercetin dioxygenase-like cupin family protein